MCTVTIIATPGGYRLVHSRDEQRSRGAGEAPAVRRFGAFRAISPRDLDAGGTWIAAREDGVTVAIMNVNPDGGAPRGARSRGLIVSDLAGAIDGDPAAAVAGLDPADYSPFRLVVVWPGSGGGGSPRVDAWTWHGGGGGGGDLEHGAVGLPVCWATSGLGDGRVAARVPLFESLVKVEPTAAAQDAFHAHAWRGRGAESVLMSRADARTVSVTVVEAGGGPVRMIYRAISAGVADRAGAGPGGGERGRAGACGGAAAALGPAAVITLG